MGKQPNLYVFSDPKTLQSNLRQYILHAQRDGLKRHDVFRVAVSGGSLPATLGEALIPPGNSQEDTIHWGKWEIFFADERAVPLDHEDSNYRLVKDDLLDKLPADSRPTVFPIDVNFLDDTQELADQYEKNLVASFAAKDSVRLPIFDLILLGCGPDGHTCSLFPGHELLRESDAWVAAIDDSPKPPPRRITLTLPVVTHGVYIAFVATGAGKKETMAKIFDTDEGQELPCGLVNAGGGDKVSWFTDGPATEGVRFPRRGSL